MHRSAASRRNVEQADYESHQRLLISVMIVSKTRSPNYMSDWTPVFEQSSYQASLPTFHCVLPLLRFKVYLTRYSPSAVASREQLPRNLG